MYIFFIFLTLVCISLFGTTAYFVMIEPIPHYHAYFGLIATVAVLITHCWVFFYFIGTGEGIREGVIEHKLDPAHIKATKKFKAKTFPFALFSMVFMIVTTILGAGIQVKQVEPVWHKGFMYFALLFNFFTFYQEQRIIKANQILMAQLNAQIGQ